MTNTDNRNPDTRKNPTKVVTGVVRLSYANVWEPKSVNGGTAKYSVSLIIPKSDTKTIEAINKAIDAAIEEGKGKFGGKVPNRSALKLPLRDGDIEQADEKLMPTATLSTQTPKQRPRSLTASLSASSIIRRSTTEYMQGYQ